MANNIVLSKIPEHFAEEKQKYIKPISVVQKAFLLVDFSELHLWWMVQWLILYKLNNNNNNNNNNNLFKEANYDSRVKNYY